MRIQNSLKNMLFGISGQMISAIMGFIVRTVFISTLGIEYLGINGLFSNILIILSVANLGFDTAIIYSLYKPFADGEQRKIQGLMNLYAKAYRIIGVIVLFIGLSLMPFLSSMMNGETNIPYIQVIYLLFLLNSVSSYFLVHKQSVIIADQHYHIISKIHSVFTVVSNLVQIILLITTRNFIAVLSAQIIFTVLKNMYIAHKANQLYPYLKGNNKVKLSEEDKKSFFKSLYSLMLYKISGVVINGSDNIIISKLIGIYWVGLYANYYLIIATLTTFVGYIFQSLKASVGNLHVKENIEKKYLIFRVIQFSNFWIYGFCSICLWHLINPFLSLWLGEMYLLNKFIVFAILLDFYTTGMQNASTTFREATGLFQKGKYRPIYAAVINLIVSVLLAQKIGIAGVFFGTVISRLCIYFWYDPYVIFKYVFGKPVNNYFIRYAGFGLLVFASGGIIEVIGFTSLVVKAFLCLLIPNVLFYVVCRRMEEFEYVFRIVKSFSNRLPFKRLEKKAAQ